MEKYTYNSEIRRMILHFMSAIDGAIVKRYDKDGNVQQEIKVNYLYANKSRIMKDVVSKTHNLSLPVAAVEFKGFQRDPKRIKNKQAETILEQRENLNRTVKLKNAVPVNLALEMSIMTAYQADMEQILTNFVAYFDPYIIIAWREPVTGNEIRSKVTWDGSANVDFESLFNTEEWERYECTVGFELEGYIYKNEIQEVAPICRIDADVSLFDLAEKFTLLPEGDETHEHERFSISGLPKPRFSNVSIVNADHPPESIIVYGTDVGHTTTVYLSADDPEMFTMSAFSPFQHDEDKVEDFPEFNGFPVNANVINDSYVSVILPPLNTSGHFDIILVNDQCGYGTLIEYAKDLEDQLINPYDISSVEYSSWTPYSLPFVNGIEVLKTFTLTCSAPSFTATSPC